MWETQEKKEEKGAAYPMSAVFVSRENLPYETVAKRFAEALLRRLSGQR